MKRWSIGLVSVALATAAFIATAAAYDVKPGKGGTIKGKCTFKGDMAKANQKNKPDKDTGDCAEHTNPTLEVGEGGGLKHAVVYLKKCDAGKEFPAEMKKATIDQVKCVFSGIVTFVMKGGEVAFKNSDKVLHNVKCTSPSYNFNEGVEAGKELVKKCEKGPEEVKISCSIHPWMEASLWVVTHPYYTQSGANGEFTLTDVPAGKYTLLAKHMKLGKSKGTEKGIEVEVKEGAEAAAAFEFSE